MIQVTFDVDCGTKEETHFNGLYLTTVKTLTINHIKKEIEDSELEGFLKELQSSKYSNIKYDTII